MMIGAELFRQGPRPRAMSIAGLTNWLFTAVVALSFELVQVADALLFVPPAEWLCSSLTRWWFRLIPEAYQNRG